jgi:hypothetical protein
MSLDIYLTIETCAVCGRGETVFEANITHNLGRMADAVGIYKACWRPEEIGATKAKDIAGSLRIGIVKMIADPEKFEAFNPHNGWGSYKHFLPWLKRYLDACEQWPEADISVSR